MRGVNRIAAVVLCLCATIFGSVGAFAGGNPGRTPVPPSAPFEVPWCGVAVGPVLVTTDVSQSYVKTFIRKDGAIVLAFNGHIVQSLSANGKTQTFNVSGPGTITIRDGSFTVVGRGLNVIGNETGIWYTSGRVVIDPTNGAIISHTGHTTNVCALLMS